MRPQVVNKHTKIEPHILPNLSSFFAHYGHFFLPPLRPPCAVFTPLIIKPKIASASENIMLTQSHCLSNNLCFILRVFLPDTVARRMTMRSSKIREKYLIFSTLVSLATIQLINLG